MKLLSTLPLLLVVSGGLCLPLKIDIKALLEQAESTTGSDDIDYLLVDDFTDVEEVDKIRHHVYTLMWTLLDSPNLANFTETNPDFIITSSKVSGFIEQELRHNADLVEMIKDVMGDIQRNPKSAELWRNIAAEVKKSYQLQQQKTASTNTNEGSDYSGLFSGFLTAFTDALLSSIVGMIFNSLE
ncbi:hypothetical protein Pmani_020348 [Petrolisthes manimaculis]|uniref:Uncharacterized protein n=1 Tax=Petrolisthes manimaculis TaxID=1843537 RepID=A0AAE1U6G8_9EUCA|nr:hypothetical protein Pmani_020348 [Petrolisthes manimaculis]